MDHDRRRFLRFAGVATAGGVAGCLGGSESGEGNETSSDSGNMGDGTSSNSGSRKVSYGWSDATWDSYWYSLYNMSTNISLSGNGVLFPHNEKQRKVFQKRKKAILKNSDVSKPPVRNPNLNMAPFTTGDPHFTQKPDFGGKNGRPDASTLEWDKSKSSGVVSPASVAWTHLKGVTWAKNFQEHFDLLPQDVAPKFRSQVLATLAQLGVKATLVAGGPDGNGALTKNPQKNMKLVSGFKPSTGKVTDSKTRHNHHAAMTWFLSDMVSLAENGWYGYVNPEPLIPPKKIQKVTDGVAKTTMNAFSPDKILSSGSTRDLGLMLAATGWYGTHAGSDKLERKAKGYADALASKVEENLAGNGMVENGAANQAATQGVVAQGLVYASQIDGVDHVSTAKDVAGYMFDTLWDDDAGTFASGEGDSTYTVTARDAGDITGGVNVADAVVERSDARKKYARYFNQTFNRGKLQRAQRPASVDENAEHSLPLPPKAGGKYGQSAVYNAEVEYDAENDEWSVTDDTFRTGDSLYLANQDIWIGRWGGQEFKGRGIPGKTDQPPKKQGQTR